MKTRDKVWNPEQRRLSSGVPYWAETARPWDPSLCLPAGWGPPLQWGAGQRGRQPDPADHTPARSLTRQVSLEDVGAGHLQVTTQDSQI